MRDKALGAWPSSHDARAARRAAQPFRCDSTRLPDRDNSTSEDPSNKSLQMALSVIKTTTQELAIQRKQEVRKYALDSILCHASVRPSPSSAGDAGPEAPAPPVNRRFCGPTMSMEVTVEGTDLDPEHYDSSWVKVLQRKVEAKHQRKLLEGSKENAKSPGENDAEVFRNRKGYFSINVQAITGPKLQFLDLVASWPGSAHDSRIFDNSRARVQYEQGDIPGILLGDMGYACRPYLMTPLRDDVLPGSPQYKYNKSQIRTRCSIERTFGVWKRRFPCLDMTLQIKTATVPIVITACAALHNLGRLLKDPVPPALLYDATRDCTAPVPVSRAAQPPATVPLVDSASGFRTRDRIIAQYFH
ncbi:uncharacterized protein LOC144117896 [Amblyomma americanum]